MCHVRSHGKAGRSMEELAGVARPRHVARNSIMSHEVKHHGSTPRFVDEALARDWFEALRWPDGRICPKCGGCKTSMVRSLTPMPHHCRDCIEYFSVRTGTTMQSSKLPMRKLALAIHLMSTDRAGAHGVRLPRELGVDRRTALSLARKIRGGWRAGSGAAQPGPGVPPAAMAQPGRGRGRPPHGTEPIPATANEIARAIFRAARPPRSEARRTP